MHLIDFFSILYIHSHPHSLPVRKHNLMTRFHKIKKWHRKFALTSQDIIENSMSSPMCSTPNGYLPVDVGDEAWSRYLIKTKHLHHPRIVEMLERSAEEYGYSQSGVLRIRCEAELFESILGCTKSGRRSVAACRTKYIDF